MLMTRIVYLTFTSLTLALNLTALWSVLGGSAKVASVVPAALVINAVTWPLALMIAYRVGQVTGVEYFRKVRAKLVAMRRAGKRTAHERSFIDR